MSILRYTASLDNTITNAFEEGLSTRGTGSNMGASDVLEAFSIYGQASSASVELSRILIQFPTAQIVSDRSTQVLPASGSVTWKLKMYNAAHFQTIPSSYTLQVSAVSASWEEGLGLDMEDYSDLLAWDFVLSREGTGLKTEYSLRVVPRKKVTNPLIEATFAEQKEKGFEIKELMTGGNPFAPGE